MQDRYVADVGDYVKCSILRGLIRGHHDWSLGVAWWLFRPFPNEHHNADGGHRDYLSRPNDWKQFDPDVFEALATIDKEEKGDVRALEDPRLFPNAVFARDPVPCDGPFAQRPSQRRRWLSKTKAQLKDCDVVFLDPDNGIAPEGLRLTLRRAGKCVTIEEIEELAQRHRTTIVYHHQTRRKGGHRAEIRHLAARLKESGLEVSGALRARPWSPRVFFILNGDKELQDRAKAIAEVWGDHMLWLTALDILEGSK